MKSIPLAKPYFSPAEGKAATDAINSGWVSQGPRAATFEKMVASYVDGAHAVATSSCTTSLHIALLLAEVGAGDEVICPSSSFIATANAISYTGARPIFAEINPRTFNIDPGDIEGRITASTKAIMPVHQIGLATDMDPIFEIAERHGLSVVEDAAPALGALYKGRKVGSLGQVACFSFHPRKIITTGEGGMILTSDAELAERARVLRSHGASISDMDRHKAAGTAYEQYPVLGYNYRMSDVHAAIGIEQMKKLDEILKLRRSLAQRYNRELANEADILTPYVPADCTHSWQSYCITLTGDDVARRDLLIVELAKLGISCRRGIPPIHLEPYYQNKFLGIHLPVTERVSRNTMFIPLYPQMTPEEQQYVIDHLLVVLRESKV